MRRTPLESWISEKIGEGQGPLTRESIERHQLAKLRETLAWSGARSNFYRQRLADAGHSELHCLADLCRIPFTTAEDVTSNPLEFLCVSQSDIERVVTLRTSGTTGESKRIYFTREDQELTIDFFHRGMATLVGRGDRVLILLPGERPGSVGDLLAIGLGRLGVHAVAYGPVQDDALALEVMIREEIDALVGIPVQVLALARQSGGLGAPRSILLSTDYVPEAIREELARIWGCAVYTHYGMTEMGYGGGVECEVRYGYHVREADLLFEIIDPESGIPVDEGEIGEVVFTTLTRRGMPLIRYRTGDLSRFLPEPCPCGTILKTMAPVTGRLTNQVKLESGTVLTMADLDEALFPIRGLLDFTAELTCRKGRNFLRITVSFLAGASGDRLEEVQRALGGIATLRSLVQKGELEFAVTVGEGRSQPLTGVTKRTLVDRRNGGVSS